MSRPQHGRQNALRDREDGRRDEFAGTGTGDNAGFRRGGRAEQKPRHCDDVPRSDGLGRDHQGGTPAPAFQTRPELVAGSREPGLDCPNRPAETGGGSLVMGQALEVAEHDGNRYFSGSKVVSAWSWGQGPVESGAPVLA